MKPESSSPQRQRRGTARRAHPARRPGSGGRRTGSGRAALRSPERGFVITLTIVVVITVLVIGSLVGIVALRNALIKRGGENIVQDATGTLIAKPLDWGICEEPLFLCKDPANGLLAQVGVRPHNFTTRNQVFYEDEDCAGEAFLAPPAVPPHFPPELAVGYLNGSLNVDATGTRVVYGVGAPADWPCYPLDPDAASDCVGAGLLYRSDAPAADVTVRSVWTSLAPDCSLAFLPGGGELPTGDLPCPLPAPPGTVLGGQKIAEGVGGFVGPLDNNDFFGSSIAELGDLNGDGLSDIAVGARGTQGNAGDEVFNLLLDAAATVIAEAEIDQIDDGIESPPPGDQFGFATAGVGDVDGDGIEDLAVGGPSDRQGRGAIWIVLLNADGTLKGSLKIPNPDDNTGDNFGSALANVGDLDGNGIDDLAVGAMGAGTAGTVWIVFLAPGGGGLLSAHKVAAPPPLGAPGLFGRSVASLGDFDGDSIIDLAVGAADDAALGPNSGAVWTLFLGADCETPPLPLPAPPFPTCSLASSTKILNPDAGTTASDRFGTGLAALPDINGDLIPDLVVGAPGDDEAPGGVVTNTGAIWVLFLGPGGTVGGSLKILNQDPPADVADDEFGLGLAALSDLNGDGCPDLAVGSPGDDQNVMGANQRGAVWILFLACVPYPTSCVPAPTGIVSWWPGDGSAEDIADGNSGALVGNVAFAPGQVDEAFDFPGSATVESHVIVADAPNLGITGELTLDAWVAFEDIAPQTPGIADSPIVAKWGDPSSGTAGYGLFIDSFGVPSFSASPDGTSVTSVSAPALTAGVFQHVAGVFTGTHLEIYVDGFLANDTPFPGASIHDTPADLTIGGYASAQSASDDSLVGLVDEVELFEVALTDCEIQQIFLAGALTFGKCKPGEGIADELCENIGPEILTVVPAVEALVDPTDLSSNNLLEGWLPPFRIMASRLTFTPAVGEDAVLQPPTVPGATTEPGLPPVFPPPGLEDDPPLPEDAPGETGLGPPPTFPPPTGEDS